MQITFANGTTLDALSVEGQGIFYQGANRDSLELQFEKGKYTFDELEALTSDPANTQRLIILDDAGETLGIHEHYTLRTEIAVRSVPIDQPITPDEPPAAEERICIRLAQKTYMEQQMDILRDTVDTLVLAEL